MPNVAFWRSPARSRLSAYSGRPGRVEEDDNDTTTKSYAEGDMLVSVENVTGSRRDDTIAGDGVPNVIRGGVGNDQLVGDAFQDPASPARPASDDTLYGGDGDDILGRRRQIDSDNDGNFTDPGDVRGIDDDPGNDTMHGGAGDDKLYGGAGNDILDGGPGDDELQGDLVVGTNSHADVFVFTPGDAASDTIIDFSATDNIALTNGTADTNGTGDKIDLSACNIEGDEAALKRLLIQRGDSVMLNLEPHGGGRVTIQNVTVEGLYGGRDWQ